MYFVHPSCRAKITPTDIDFISRILCEQREHGSLLRLLSDEESRDQVLDDPHLFDAIQDSPAYLQLSLELYFYIIVRHIFKEANIRGCDFADYIASILSQFAKNSPPLQATQQAREPFFYAIDILDAIERTSGRERFHLITWLGEQALMLTGVFPDHVRYREKTKAAPGLRYYEAVGSAQFQAASNHRLAHEFDLSHIYQSLSESFREVRKALNEMRERVMFLGEFPPDPK